MVKCIIFPLSLSHHTHIHMIASITRYSTKQYMGKLTVLWKELATNHRSSTLTGIILLAIQGFRFTVIYSHITTGKTVGNMMFKSVLQ